MLTYYAALASEGDWPGGSEAVATKAWLGRAWEDWRDEVLEYLRASGEGIDRLVYRVDVRLLGEKVAPPLPPAPPLPRTWERAHVASKT
eukprot:SAG22_NODE_4539_length_1240_cov_1.273444_1_plen_89_part_00